MAFTIPENLHPDLMPLAWLVGSWRGKGRGEYPNVPGFQFAQEVSFNHDGRPFLNYFSRSWIIDENMDQGYSSPSAKIVTAGSRLYGLVEGELFTSYDMAAEGQTLQAHLWSSLERQG